MQEREKKNKKQQHEKRREMTKETEEIITFGVIGYEVEKEKRKK